MNYLVKYRGVRNALTLFVTYAGTIALYAKNAKPEWGPLLGAAFGCFALCIGIQQAYAYATEAKQRSSEKYVYFWSSATLFLFGIGTVCACLPNIDQAGVNASAQRIIFVASTALFAFGFVTLLRFAASYLFRGTQGILSNNLLIVFRWRWIFEPHNVAELLHLIFCAVVMVTAAYYYFDPSVTLSPLSSKSPVYFPFPVSKTALCYAGIATAVALGWFFKSKYQRIKQGSDELDGIRFMASMAILFFVPCIIQTTALAPWASKLGLDDTAVVGLWSAGLSILAIVILLVTFGIDSDVAEQPSVNPIEASNVTYQTTSTAKTASDISDQATKNRVKSTNVAIAVSLALCAGLAFLLYIQPPLLLIIPFGFVTLGFMTLASAYLPIDDLERVKLKQRQPSG